MADPHHQGKFITLEGGEGAGKSTQVRAIAERLAARGIETLTTREPGGSAKAEELREVILSGFAKQFSPIGEAMLFSAARIDHLDQTIRPALARGVWVVCDRFMDSTQAYQGALGNIDPRLIKALERVAVGPTRPDLTLILDLPAEIGLARAAARRKKGAAADRFEGEDLEFHQALRKSFLEIAAAELERCAVIDAAQDVDQVSAQIWDEIRRRLLKESV
ncbi:dTMP kinase [Methylovirgula sp. 4M-Z18]|uniref:dTMP kinase n=1 Tax=Methylovirgula sp. 4M-Z18 TaxID=2293567 RepID=UPI000E2E74DB|nr:dTMP kinase [Methylovirgula sp. 4M-Z18]RFB80546.1 dTMP kinase [Methylovirgula sp. 4M-Z18]